MVGFAPWIFVNPKIYYCRQQTVGNHDMKKTLFMLVCLLSFLGVYGLLRAKADTTSFPAQGAAGFVIEDNVLLEYRGHEAKVVIPFGNKAKGGSICWLFGTGRGSAVQPDPGASGRNF